jgi:hypothetical protein
MQQSINPHHATLTLQCIVVKGFDACDGLPDNFTGPWTERRTSQFKSHYGSSPVVLANINYLEQNRFKRAQEVH